MMMTIRGNNVSSDYYDADDSDNDDDNTNNETESDNDANNDDDFCFYKLANLRK